MKLDVDEFVNKNKNEAYKLLEELCKIPAPSHHEERRAQYCKDFFDKIGAKGAYIDEAKNVVLPINCEDSNKITVFCAHTDTVFSDTEPMPYTDDGEKIFCPGVCDDTANLVGLMMLAKFLTENKISISDGMLLVCNSCEEGLGNLKGTKQILKDYKDRIKEFISFDLFTDTIINNCVGSHRYEVEVKTEGGHSYGDFGNNNAIYELSKIINKIYNIEVPQKEGAKVTYNVGEITGGTSVNTIAQNAKMLCEYRSDDSECLDFMEQKFNEIFDSSKSGKAEVNVKVIGKRPCSKTDKAKIDILLNKVRPVMEEITGQKIGLVSASTDCNIPLSLGISALCVGLCRGGKVHTREEWMYKDSLITGVRLAIGIALKLIEG